MRRSGISGIGTGSSDCIRLWNRRRKGLQKYKIDSPTTCITAKDSLADLGWRRRLPPIAVTGTAVVLRRNIRAFRKRNKAYTRVPLACRYGPSFNGPFLDAKNLRRNGHGTRSTGAVEPSQRQRAAALPSRLIRAALGGDGVLDHIDPLVLKARVSVTSVVAEVRHGAARDGVEVPVTWDRGTAAALLAQRVVTMYTPAGWFAETVKHTVTAAETKRLRRAKRMDDGGRSLYKSGGKRSSQFVRRTFTVDAERRVSLMRGPGKKPCHAVPCRGCRGSVGVSQHLPLAQPVTDISSDFFHSLFIYLCKVQSVRGLPINPKSQERQEVRRKNSQWRETTEPTRSCTPLHGSRHGSARTFPPQQFWGARGSVAIVGVPVHHGQAEPWKAISQHIDCMKAGADSRRKQNEERVTSRHCCRASCKIRTVKLRHTLPGSTSDVSTMLSAQRDSFRDHLMVYRLIRSTNFTKSLTLWNKILVTRPPELKIPCNNISDAAIAYDNVEHGLYSRTKKHCITRYCDPGYSAVFTYDGQKNGGENMAGNQLSNHLFADATSVILYPLLLLPLLSIACTGFNQHDFTASHVHFLNDPLPEIRLQRRGFNRINGEGGFWTKTYHALTIHVNMKSTCISGIYGHIHT
ncbi:hypothetical protein B0H16DRAFT_1458080 [Mycena metata]|uniref:Uncharacterized protein n=1 Tax=Mycena metata TaxID=1033252 RepID=A0AAD7J5H8_9AGAR|nr:hypothetical protein B0H16DRAFT_1458080 [Mycena metata]